MADAERLRRVPTPMRVEAEPPSPELIDWQRSSQPWPGLECCGRSHQAIEQPLVNALEVVFGQREMAVVVREARLDAWDVTG